MSKNVRTDCILENELFELTAFTSIINYAEVWWNNKKGKTFINTGLYVDIRQRNFVEALQRHSYKLKPMDYSDVVVNIQEYGVYRMQIIVDVEEPKPLTYNDLLAALTKMKEVDRGLLVSFFDIITEKEYFLQGVNRGYIKIMEVHRADSKN
jgi:hypothetical protein